MLKKESLPQLHLVQSLKTSLIKVPAKLLLALYLTVVPTLTWGGPTLTLERIPQGLSRAASVGRDQILAEGLTNSTTNQLNGSQLSLQLPRLLRDGKVYLLSSSAAEIACKHHGMRISATRMTLTVPASAFANDLARRGNDQQIENDNGSINLIKVESGSLITDRLEANKSLTTGNVVNVVQTVHCEQDSSRTANLPEGF